MNLKVSTVTTGGYTGLTTLSTGSLPAGVTGTFTPPTLGPNTSGLLTLTTSGSTPSSASIEVRGIATIEGTAITRTGTTLLNVQAAGQTVLAGQVLDENDKPLAGVSIKLGGSTITGLGTTDAAGNFLVNLSVAGLQVFLIDGSTANTPPVSYPTIPVTLNIQAGTVNSLGFIPHLIAQAVAKLQPITPGQATVVTDPDLPGFSMTIPSGVSITGWDGQPNTQVSVRQVPIDRTPLPPVPTGVSARALYLFSFGKVGGGTPTGNIPINTPNDVDGLPGEKIDLYFFNEAPDGSAPNAWEKYGTGTISQDGRRVLTDVNPSTGQPYGIPRFCCGARVNGPPPPTNKPGGGASGGGGDAGQGAGEPVDTATGFFYLTKTDLVLPGIVPLVITRTYRTNLTNTGPFGLGSSAEYDRFLQPPPNGSPDALLLFSPGNRQDLLARQPDGSFRNFTSPALQGAVVTVAGGLRTLRFKDGSTWQFRTSDGLLVAQSDRNGNTLSITRDAQGRVTALTEPRGRQLTFSYTGTNLRIDQITDPLGRTVRYTYDAQGRLERVTDPAGGLTQYTYDANHRLLTITDPRNITFLTNEFDAQGRVSRQTQADGGVFTFEYAVSGGFITSTKVTDPRGNATTSRFNSAGYLIQQTDALGQTTSFERQPGTNLLLSTTDPLGRVTRFTYDASGNVTSVTDPLNNTRTFTYDPTFNKVTSITDPLGNLTTFEYNAQGNLISTTDPVQNTRPPADRLKTTFTYNTAGQPLTTADPLGNTTTFEYDSTGNLVRIIDSLGNPTTRSYDTVSRLITQTDALGKTTRFSYDALNRLASILDALNGVTTFGYDPNGNLLTVTDARGNTISQEYDTMNRLATRTDPLSRQEFYQHDPNGNLTQFTDRKNQASTFTYDPLNRRTRATFADGSFTEFTYDGAGNLLTAIDSLSGTITQTYDALNRLASEVTPQGAITYGYDAAGRRQAMQINGVLPVSYGFDAASRLTGITQGQQAAMLSYDPTNRRTSLTLPNGIIATYTYDNASRLIAQSYAGPQGPLGDLTYTYDANGNRIGTGGTWARSGIPTTIATSSYDGANQQLAFGGVTQTFDANGNVQTQADSSGTTTYTWDARNRLAAINGPNVSATFTYDASGRRISKTINGDAATFHYDGLDAVKETGAAGEVSYLRTLAIDEALARTDASGTLGYLTDILGSTVALADSGAAVSSEYTYEPFGTTQVSGQPSPNPFQFTGRENDSSGLYYYRERYYAPRLARFIEQDGLGIRGGVNLYAYLGGSPLNFVDPLGLFRVRIHDIGGRQGPAYGATVVVESDDGTKSVTVPGSSWPNPNNPNPGIAPGTYDARYSQTGHKGQDPGIRLRDGGPIPTVGPNPNQGNQAYSTGINIHCGWSGTWRGSAGCITIHPDYCQKVWDILNQGERGSATVNRNERSGF